MSRKVPSRTIPVAIEAPSAGSRLIGAGLPRREGLRSDKARALPRRRAE